MKRIANTILIVVVRVLNNVFESIVFFSFLVFWYLKFLVVKKIKSQAPRVMVGTFAILNNKYWANALKETNIQAKSVVNSNISVMYTDEDFDVYLDKIFPVSQSTRLQLIRKLRIINYLTSNFDVLQINCEGLILGETPFWKYEAWLLKKAECKIIVIPYGTDFYRYTKIFDNSLRHVLLYSFPSYAKMENKIEEHYMYWTKNADVFYSGNLTDGANRWDILLPSGLQINTNEWTPKSMYSQNDGKNGIVYLIHAPTHRTVKGSEFIFRAVEELKLEGLKIELILLENKQNSEVKKIMREKADILIEALIFTGNGLTGIEGMVSGLPVMANLDNENLTRVFRRFSFLNECPVLSTTPENVKENIKRLVVSPKLRETLGKAGRQYVEKYHSFKTYQFIFSRLLDKIWYNKEVDLMNLFHPMISSSYNNRLPLIIHPLVDNKLPKNYQEN